MPPSTGCRSWCSTTAGRTPRRIGRKPPGWPLGQATSTSQLLANWRSLHADEALRYAAVLSLPGRTEPGRTDLGDPPITDRQTSSSLRWYAERARADGAHDLENWLS